MNSLPTRSPRGCEIVMEILWVDNKVAHDAICQTFANLIERLAACENAIMAHHKHLESQPPIDANLFMYKPKGEKDHLNIGKNLDLIYQRLVELEAMAHKAPRTNHGEKTYCFRGKDKWVVIPIRVLIGTLIIVIVIILQ